MSRIKKVHCHDGAHYGIRFQCPGCNDEHVIPTKPYERGWDFNGDEDRPTVSPSILLYESKRWDGTKAVPTPRCHSFIREGRIEFCSDSTHELAGKTVDLPECSGDEA